MTRPISACLFAIALSACGPDIEAICEDFVDECGDLNDDDQCVQRAEFLEQQAEDRDCLTEWALFLDCIDSANSLCSTESSCAFERNQLEKCGVTFGEE